MAAMLRREAGRGQRAAGRSGTRPTWRSAAAICACFSGGHGRRRRARRFGAGRSVSAQDPHVRDPGGRREEAVMLADPHLDDSVGWLRCARCPGQEPRLLAPTELTAPPLPLIR